jgi:hypothetical protein
MSYAITGKRSCAWFGIMTDVAVAFKITIRKFDLCT